MRYAISKKTPEKESAGKRQAGKTDDLADRTVRCGVNPKLAQVLG